MKRISLALAVLFFSGAAMAHPGDQSPISDLDLGSRIVFQANLNIPASNNIVIQNGARFIGYMGINPNMAFCQVGIYDASGKPFGRDAMVIYNDTYVLFEKNYSNTVELSFYSYRGNILRLNCACELRAKGPYGIPNIGSFRSILSSMARVEFADPVHPLQ